MTARPPDWTEHFPSLPMDDAPSIRAAAQRVSVPAGAIVFRTGDVCERYILVISGSARVRRLSADGKEIVLYRVESGQSCILTTSCLLAGEHYPAEALAETDLDAVLIPAEAFDRGMAESSAFRRFVLSAYGERVTSLISLVEGVAFRRIDSRLASCLLQRGQRADGLRCTHQNLALELGTAREVISRQLKQFEREGLLSLHRGRIELANPEGLRGLAAAN
ncbi:MAG: Crp/Fnr family transcriptional regulator [Gammaproteobacteria bacterium]